MPFDPWRALSGAAVMFAGVFAWLARQGFRRLDRHDKRIGKLEERGAGLVPLRDSVEALRLEMRTNHAANQAAQDQTAQAVTELWKELARSGAIRQPHHPN